MENFTPVSALLGGGLIGLAASAMLWLNGRIAGISGIYSGLLKPSPGDVGWRLAFVGGLIAGGLALLAVSPDVFGLPTGRSTAAVAVAGALVGVGVRMGNGCTSGHGVCGLTRFSRRSIVATARSHAANVCRSLAYLSRRPCRLPS